MPKTYDVTISGVTPLLQHRFPMGGAEAVTRQRTGVPDYRAEAEVALYKDPDGRVYEPASHIEAAIRNAAATFKVPGRRGASYAKLMASSVSVVPDAILHRYQEWTIDSRPVVIQRARIVRYRPRLDKWELHFNILVMDDQIPGEVVKQILDYAGRAVGIGDFRPATKGKYGQFMVTSFNEIES